jgi:hypothetical protein
MQHVPVAQEGRWTSHWTQESTTKVRGRIKSPTYLNYVMKLQYSSCISNFGVQNAVAIAKKLTKNIFVMSPTQSQVSLTTLFMPR